MAVNILMPKLGLTMKEGRVEKWFKKQGDPVKKDEEIAEISTDKITNTVSSPANGILGRIIAAEGDVVAVSEIIGIIYEEGEKIEEQHHPAEKSDESGEKAAEQAFVKATPVAKKLAKEHGIDISSIIGTGPGGRITEEDVKKKIDEQKRLEETEKPMCEKAAERKDDAQTKRVPMDAMRRTISERMKMSWSSAPHVTENIKVDVTELLGWKDRLSGLTGHKFTVTDFIAKACVEALKKVPALNWSIEGDSIIQNGTINLGIAVAVENGLMVPNIKDAGAKTLLDISREIKDLGSRARENSLLPEEISGGTFTITNLGMYGIYSFTPIINPPESAILGVNAISQEPAVKDGSICIRSVMILSLSFDHRLIDGATAAAFLSEIKKMLENPELFAL
ncbi:MAG: 2-oxo acid dehydrogenase subunit E2 [Tepidanaerobacteraceae bacterium]|jgi:pyruvate dehydrogenase E2 component (dihydrolipoamide acetyltransferase)|nr:2-oxo acid dehydrogenase subunit E2 [Tepidanaerobacteraceae bacterium]